MELPSYRDILKETLAERVRKNPAYSLRAFAKQIGLASSTVCEIMKGRGNLSAEAALRIANRMEFDERETERFCALVRLESAKSQEAKQSALSHLNRLQPNQEVHYLAIDQFKVVADWYCSALLELTQLKGFDFNVKNAAKRLGISITEVEVALERLIRLNLIRICKSGKFEKTQAHFQVKSSVPNEAIRKYYKQTLAKAIEAVDLQSPAEKLSGAETLPLDVSQLPKAEKIMNQFFEDMIALSRSGKKKTAVFNLNVHFFNLIPERK